MTSTAHPAAAAQLAAEMRLSGSVQTGGCATTHHTTTRSGGEDEERWRQRHAVAAAHAAAAKIQAQARRMLVARDQHIYTLTEAYVSTDGLLRELLKQERRARMAAELGLAAKDAAVSASRAEVERLRAMLAAATGGVAVAAPPGPPTVA